MTILWGTQLNWSSSADEPEYFWFLLEVAITTTIAAGTVNLIPDYLSLLESRYIIRLMSRAGQEHKILVLLVLDFVVTALIAIVSIIYFQVRIGAALFDFPSISINSMDDLYFTIQYKIASFHSLSSYVLSLAVFFYSTFFTSVWVWLFALSGMVVKIAGYFTSVLSRIAKILDIENKPLRSMGFVSIALVTLLFLVSPFLR